MASLIGRHCGRSEAIRGAPRAAELYVLLDCFVAALLAMTGEPGWSRLPPGGFLRKPRARFGPGPPAARAAIAAAAPAMTPPVTPVDDAHDARARHQPAGRDRPRRHQASSVEPMMIVVSVMISTKTSGAASSAGQPRAAGSRGRRPSPSDCPACSARPPRNSRQPSPARRGRLRAAARPARSRA